MFTGIIECLGKIENIEQNGSNKSFWLSATFINELKIDQSVSHNGVCLTVEEIKNNRYKVTAIEETLKKTDLSKWNVCDEINLERCMIMNGRIDGHIVQGHVDTTAVCIGKKTLAGSWEYNFEFDEKFSALIIEKGSVAVNGASLTAFNVGKNNFTAAIIPYTFEHTNFKMLQPQMLVNIEFDLIGKYIQRIIKQ